MNRNFELGERGYGFDLPCSPSPSPSPAPTLAYPVFLVDISLSFWLTFTKPYPASTVVVSGASLFHPHSDRMMLQPGGSRALAKHMKVVPRLISTCV